MEKVKGRILVIDDDPEILESVRTVLEFKGFEVYTESEGENVMPVVEEIKPDIIILDVLLSGSGGRDLCKTLKELEHTKHIPVIIFSANVNFHEVVKSCKADDFIAKPFEVNLMLARINMHMGIS